MALSQDEQKLIDSFKSKWLSKEQAQSGLDYYRTQKTKQKTENPQSISDVHESLGTKAKNAVKKWVQTWDKVTLWGLTRTAGIVEGLWTGISKTIGFGADLNKYNPLAWAWDKVSDFITGGTKSQDNTAKWGDSIRAVGDKYWNAVKSGAESIWLNTGWMNYWFWKFVWEQAPAMASGTAVEKLALKWLTSTGSYIASKAPSIAKLMWAEWFAGWVARVGANVLAKWTAGTAGSAAMEMTQWDVPWATTVAWGLISWTLGLWGSLWDEIWKWAIGKNKTVLRSLIPDKKESSVLIDKLNNLDNVDDVINGVKVADKEKSANALSDWLIKTVPPDGTRNEAISALKNRQKEAMALKDTYLNKISGTYVIKEAKRLVTTMVDDFRRAGTIKWEIDGYDRLVQLSKKSSYTAKEADEIKSIAQKNFDDLYTAEWATRWDKISAQRVRSNISTLKTKLEQLFERKLPNAVGDLKNINAEIGMSRQAATAMEKAYWKDIMKTIYGAGAKLGTGILVGTTLWYSGLSPFWDNPTANMILWMWLALWVNKATNKIKDPQFAMKQANRLYAEVWEDGMSMLDKFLSGKVPKTPQVESILSKIRGIFNPKYALLSWAKQITE